MMVCANLTLRRFSGAFCMVMIWIWGLPGGEEMVRFSKVGVDWESMSPSVGAGAVSLIDDMPVGLGEDEGFEEFISPSVGAGAVSLKAML